MSSESTNATPQSTPAVEVGILCKDCGKRVFDPREVAIKGDVARHLNSPAPALVVRAEHSRGDDFYIQLAPDYALNAADDNNEFGADQLPVEGDQHKGEQL